ncbi:unnamed protein product, partial [Meganyctiphanes norvegica]
MMGPTCLEPSVGSSLGSTHLMGTDTGVNSSQEVEDGETCSSYTNTGSSADKNTLVLQVASLILQKCQALPIKLKILLDRLFSLLSKEEFKHLLSAFGWTYEDYKRGYRHSDQSGNTLQKWHMISPEEERIILHHFLLFKETKAIAQQLLKSKSSRCESNDHEKLLRDPGDDSRFQGNKKERFSDFSNEKPFIDLKDQINTPREPCDPLRMVKDPIKEFKDTLGYKKHWS